MMDGIMMDRWVQLGHITMAVHARIQLSRSTKQPGNQGPATCSTSQHHQIKRLQATPKRALYMFSRLARSPHTRMCRLDGCISHGQLSPKQPAVPSLDTTPALPPKQITIFVHITLKRPAMHGPLRQHNTLLNTCTAIHTTQIRRKRECASTCGM